MISRPTEQTFTEKLEHYRARVNSKLNLIMKDCSNVPQPLREAMEYSVLGGGKRIRPLLVYASGEALGLDENLLDPIAAAVELIHAYSLIHDDLPSMDNDDIRRGRPTTHRAFNEATAILAGDSLQALAFSVITQDPLLATHPKALVQIISRLALAIGPSGMVGGQMLDIEAEGTKIDEITLENIHRRKTGELIRASIMMPCELSTESVADITRLDKFGRDIGLVFQIRDDLLEAKEDTETIGKNTDSDRRNKKSTYPSLFGIDGAERRATKICDRAMENLAELGSRAAILQRVSDYILNRSN